MEIHCVLDWHASLSLGDQRDSSTSPEDLPKQQVICRGEHLVQWKPDCSSCSSWWLFQYTDLPQTWTSRPNCSVVSPVPWVRAQTRCWESTDFRWKFRLLCSTSAIFSFTASPHNTSVTLYGFSRASPRPSLL